MKACVCRPLKSRGQPTFICHFGVQVGSQKASLVPRSGEDDCFQVSIFLKPAPVDCGQVTVINHLVFLEILGRVVKNFTDQLPLVS